jgi:hypothetical protein
MLLNIKTQYLNNPDNEIEIDDIKVIYEYLMLQL